MTLLHFLQKWGNPFTTVFPVAFLYMTFVTALNGIVTPTILLAVFAGVIATAPLKHLLRRGYHHFSNDIYSFSVDVNADQNQFETYRNSNLTGVRNDILQIIDETDGISVLWSNIESNQLSSTATFNFTISVNPDVVYAGNLISMVERGILRDDRIEGLNSIELLGKNVTKTDMRDNSESINTIENYRQERETVLAEQEHR